MHPMELLGDMGHVESRFFPFGDSVSAKKSFWMHLMLPLGDEAQVEACFGPFRQSANLGARKVHGSRRMYNRLRNHFGHTGWNSKVMWVMWNLTCFS
jgi:hypothetical protein